MPERLPLLMDRAYEGNETRQLVLELGMVPVVPPKSNRVDPWRYDRALYRKRKLNGSFADSKVTAASSPASRNWIASSSPSFASPSSSKLSDSVNTP